MITSREKRINEQATSPTSHAMSSGEVTLRDGKGPTEVETGSSAVLSALCLVYEWNSLL